MFCNAVVTVKQSSISQNVIFQPLQSSLMSTNLTSLHLKYANNCHTSPCFSSTQWYERMPWSQLSMQRHMSIDSFSLLISNSTQYVVFHHAVKNGDSVLSHCFNIYGICLMLFLSQPSLTLPRAVKRLIQTVVSLQSSCRG